MELEIIMFSEVRQAQRDKICMFSLICRIYTKLRECLEGERREEKRMMGCGGNNTKIHCIYV
jgi:hypothetical protein